MNERKITKKDKSVSIVYVIEDENGTKYETFSESIAKIAKELMIDKKKAIFDHEPNGNFAPKLKSISDAGEVSRPDPEPVD